MGIRPVEPVKSLSHSVIIKVTLWGCVHVKFMMNRKKKRIENEELVALFTFFPMTIKLTFIKYSMLSNILGTLYLSAHLISQGNDARWTLSLDLSYLKLGIQQMSMF